MSEASMFGAGLLLGWTSLGLLLLYLQNRSLVKKVKFLSHGEHSPVQAPSLLRQVRKKLLRF